jgi:hypothetical protein
MANFLNSREGIDVKADVQDQKNWLIDSVAALAAEGKDVGNFGIAGLTADANFLEMDDATIKRMVEELLAYRGRTTELNEAKDTSMRNSNVATYALNDVAYNAKMGYEGGEWADEHRDALVT